MGSDNRKKRRSDRHNKKETDSDILNKKKSRSANKQSKINILHRTFEKNHEKESHKKVAFKTRMDRHTDQNDQDMGEDSDPDVTKQYIPARKATEYETIKMEEVNRSQRKKAVKGEKEPFQFKWKHLIVSVGTVIVLALIAYTTILYGGKLFVDESKLLITPPTTVETEDGEILWYLYDEYRLPVDLDEIPDHVIEAFIAVEDKRFYSHGGVDMRSVLRAIYKDIIARDKVEGASTITQQLAKNLFLTNDKSWMRKTKEAMIALYLEREFTKDEILEMYLNVIYFGQGQYGVEAASNKFFYKSVEDLSIEEGALLAGIVNAPNGYSPIDHPEKAKKRRNIVLDRMEAEEVITADAANEAKEKEIELNISQRKYNPAYNTVVDMAVQEAQELYDISEEELKQNRYRIVTSIDETAQQIAYEQFQYDAYFPGNNPEDVEGAFVMMKQDTGQVAAAIGGRQFQYRNNNRVTSAVGQPGSTMKPLSVYAPALETGNYDPYSVLPDELEEWDGKPVRNNDDQYDGGVTLYNAVKQSKNTSAVWLLDDIGVDTGKKYLDKMHFDVGDDNARRLALGDLSVNVSPKEMMQSYRPFIHSGEMVDAYIIDDIYNQQGDIVASANPETTNVFSSQVAWNITEMLKQVVSDGTATSGYYPFELAGKTGTTQHPIVEGQVKDAWFVGYTPDYVSALWMGYDEVTEENYLTGGSAYSTELTKKILTEIANQKNVTQTFSKPDGVVALADPIDLPKIDSLSSSFVFGGFKILKANLSWDIPNDARIVYRIYEVGKNGEEDKKIGEVTDGKSEFEVDKFMLFQTKSFYVVPYDPLGDITGDPSNVVEVSF